MFLENDRKQSTMYVNKWNLKLKEDPAWDMETAA